MKLTTSAAACLALISHVLAQTAGFDAISKPTTDEVLPAGSTFEVTWDYNAKYDGTISITLLEGATPSTLELGDTVASGIDNSAGSYSWTVGKDLGDKATYGLKITLDSDPSTFQYSFPFKISASSEGAAGSSTSAGSVNTFSSSASAAASASSASSEASPSEVSSYVSASSTAATTAVATTAVATTVTKATPATGEGSTATAIGTAAQTTLATVTSASSASTASTASSASSASSTESSTTSSPSAVVTAGASKVVAGTFVAMGGLAAALFAL